MKTLNQLYDSFIQLKEDFKNSESTEQTLQLIVELGKLGIHTEDVTDYHISCIDDESVREALGGIGLQIKMLIKLITIDHTMLFNKAGDADSLIVIGKEKKGDN